MDERSWNGWSYADYIDECDDVYAIKNGNREYSRVRSEFVEALKGAFDDGQLWSTPPVLAVVPRSGHGRPPYPPLVTETPLKDICDDLVELKLAADCIQLLKRNPEPDALPRGAWVKQKETLEVAAELLQGVESLILLDDVVTTGATFAGAAAAVEEAGFEGEIYGLFFAHKYHHTHRAPRERRLKVTITPEVSGHWCSWEGTGKW